jgi:ABC-type transporter Mla subunit MlaD
VENGRERMKAGLESASSAVDTALEEARKARERLESELTTRVDQVLTTFSQQAGGVMDSAAQQIDGLTGRVETVREQLLAPLDTIEASIAETNFFSQVLEQARTQVGTVMEGLEAQVRALAA